jgi:acylpyruvate hydrolase
MDKIICVGKNYLDHAKELGDAVPEKPVLFLKPPSAVKRLDQMGGTIRVVLPKGKGTIHPECEIILLLDENGEASAVSLGLDMTLREKQAELKKAGLPWEISKVFKDAAIIGPWLPLSGNSDFLDEVFTFSLDGTVRQKAKGRDMRFLPSDCLKYAKECFPLCKGDVLFTGTPAGVGSVVSGQVGELRWGNRLAYQVQFE